MTRNSMRGFTLIELLVVIVVLAILAVIAAPRFLNLQSDARSSIVQGLSAALRTGSDLVHAKAVIEGVDSGSDEIEIDGYLLSIRSGYPRVAANCERFTSDLRYWVDMQLKTTCSDTVQGEAEWYGEVSRNQFYFFPVGYDQLSQGCYIIYTTASERVNGEWSDADSASIEYDTSGC
ncbi:type II secretion system protein [Vibrio astriarenae]|uniref:type II secretion system protein n=1 Tax=Vibrio astriarenae TaxID=1481923 RepID=UPI003735AA7C